MRQILDMTLALGTLWTIVIIAALWPATFAALPAGLVLSGAFVKAWRAGAFD